MPARLRASDVAAAAAAAAAATETRNRVDELFLSLRSLGVPFRSGRSAPFFVRASERRLKRRCIC